MKSISLPDAAQIADVVAAEATIALTVLIAPVNVVLAPENILLPLNVLLLTNTGSTAQYVPVPLEYRILPLAPSDPFE